MIKVRTKELLAVFALSLALTAGLAGCSAPAESSATVEGLTGGVAATVNGTEIAEDTITTYIDSFRKSTGMTDEESWGSYLASTGLDPASLREEVIEFYISLELERAGAEEMGVSVSEEEVTEQIAKMRANYSSDEAWEEALAQAGMTEDEYRDNVMSSMLESHMEEKFGEEADPVTDEELLEEVALYADYFNGAKRSSHILFAEEDKEKAEKVLAQLKNGEIDFADAAKENSQDTGSAERGGDIGWDMMIMMQGSGLVDEYNAALDELGKDEMTDELVQSTYGYHIIKVTDVYEVPEGGVKSLDQAPEELVEFLRANKDATRGSDAFHEWLDTAREEADVVINEMPEGLPYDLDITKYQTEEEAMTDEELLIDEDGEATVEFDEEDGTISGELTDEEAAALLEEEGLEEGADVAESDPDAEMMEEEFVDEEAVVEEEAASSE